MKFRTPLPPAPPLIPCPALDQPPRGVFWRPHLQFIQDIQRELSGKKVLEIFAGNGYLAGLLHAEGIAVTATSILSSMDAHTDGIYHPIHRLEARQAVAEFGADHDVLLMCWPTVTSAALEACILWGDKPILYIGEYTDYSRHHLGGCATDDFFREFCVLKTFPSYQGNMLEKAAWGHIASSHTVPSGSAPKTVLR